MEKQGKRRVVLLLLAPFVAALGVAAPLATEAAGGSVAGSGALSSSSLVNPGDRISAGYDLAFTGSHQAATLHASGATALIKLSCKHAKAPAGRLVIPLRDGAYSIGANDTAWHATAAAGDPASFQGTGAVPDLCGGKKMWVDGVTYSTTIRSGDTRDAVSVRFHAVDAGSIACSSTGQNPSPGSDACQAAWSRASTTLPGSDGSASVPSAGSGVGGTTIGGTGSGGLLPGSGEGGGNPVADVPGAGGVASIPSVPPVLPGTLPVSSLPAVVPGTLTVPAAVTGALHTAAGAGEVAVTTVTSALDALADRDALAANSPATAPTSGIAQPDDASGDSTDRPAGVPLPVVSQQPATAPISPIASPVGMPGLLLTELPIKWFGGLAGLDVLLCIAIAMRRRRAHIKT